MIPLRAELNVRRLSLVTWLLMLANFGIFFFQVQLGERISGFIQEFALIPRVLWTLHNPHGFELGYPIRTLITSAFLHGNWLHLVRNMLMLWVFGPGVEDRMGHIRFLAFYLICGILSGLGHAAFLPQSDIPCLGASGAIAGIMGAGLVLFPRAGVLTLVPIFVIIRLVRVPAVLFFVFWFFTQILMARASAQHPDGTGQIAVMAHIVGFLAGFLLVWLPYFRLPRRRRA